MMKILLVGGTWDEFGGKPSKVVNSLCDSILCASYFRVEVVTLNGGYLQEVQQTLECRLLTFDVVIWMPNISNDVEDKFVDNIKKLHPKCTLVQTKRCIEKEYVDGEIVQRLLRSHANLGIKIHSEDGKFVFTLVDPLGNIYTSTESVQTLGSFLYGRLETLRKFTRYRSTSLGDKQPIRLDEDFIDCVRSVAHKFGPLVSGANPERFLGNAATRCSYGFPAQRLSQGLAVSKRNVNKEMITADQFVQVEENTPGRVLYYGFEKPSVDAPIQLELFKYYPGVIYMIHGHVYVEEAPFTESKIPCGCVDEVVEIIKLYPNSASTNFTVNLKGHGCIMLADNVDYFRTQNFYARPFWEG